MNITVMPAVNPAELLRAARDLFGEGLVYELRTGVRMGALVLEIVETDAPAEPWVLGRDDWAAGSFVDGMYVIGGGTL